MNQTIRDMLERRSIRKFKPDMIKKELLDQIIKAGLYAASGMGKQPTRIIAVTNKELRDKISGDNQKIGGWQDGFDPFYGAPVILIVLTEKECANRVYDGSLVMGNLMLAAHALGIGSCWIHRCSDDTCHNLVWAGNMCSARTWFTTFNTNLFKMFGFLGF